MAAAIGNLEIEERIDIVPLITTTTLNGTLTLTATSSSNHSIVGTQTGFKVAMPDATTLAVGFSVTLLNDSSESFNVLDTSLNILETVDAGRRLIIYLYDTGTANGSWNLDNGVDEKVKVSSNDTTTGFLADKLIVGNESNTTSALEIKEINDGADEDLKIALDETKLTITTSQISDLTNSPNGIKFGYNGNANAGRYMEMQQNISSNNTPYHPPINTVLSAISVDINGVSTVTFEVLKNDVQIDTLVITASSSGEKIGLSHTILNTDKIKVKVLSGVASQPILYVYFG